MRLLALLAALAAVALGGACAGGPRLGDRDPAAGLSEAAAAEVLARFCRALEAGRFEEAHALLAARWKAAYTPGRLALDRAGAGPAGAEAAARVLAALGTGAPVREGDRAVLAVDAGRAAVVVAEEGGWRVTALE